MSNPVSEPASAQPVRPRKKRGFLFKVTLLILLIAGALAIPPVFRGVVWVVLEEEAVRQGGFLRMKSIEGSLWQPVVIRNLRWETAGALGGILKLEAERADAVFRWESLLPRSSGTGFFELLSLRGVNVEWENKSVSSKKRPFYKDLNLGTVIPVPMPSKIEMEIKKGLLEAHNFSVRLEDTIFDLSTLAPGELKAGKVDVSGKTLRKSFREVSAKTVIQGTRVQLWDMALLEGLKLYGLTVDCGAVGAGQLDFEMHAQAFGGELRLRAQAVAASQGAPLEASGSFSKLSMAPLAAFLGYTEAAGGVLEEGKFTFRGSPGKPEEGTATLRLEARNFQWETRQWDSLVVGATLIDRKIQIPEFSLQQGHNRLWLSGDVQMPAEAKPWWKSDFGMNVTARIDNLTELSALLLPEFKYTAGGLTVDGSIRSQAGVLGGALIVAGSKLKWRNAPIEELNAAVKLEGSDVRVLNAELVNKSDLIRAKGLIHVGDEWWYQGEFRARLENLANYADLLQPVLPEPYVGEINMEWAGRGAATAYEGTFSGGFAGIRPVKPKGNWPNRLNGDVRGDYNTQRVSLDRFSVGDGRVVLQGKCVSEPEGLRFSELQFFQPGRVSMEGEIFLPAVLSKSWPAVNWLGVLKADLPLEAKLKMDRMDFAELVRLPGMPAGLRGEVSGIWESGGTFANLSGGGSLTFSKCVFPMEELVLRNFSAGLELKGKTLEGRGISWATTSGSYTATVDLEWKEGQTLPSLNAQVSTEEGRWQNLGGVRFPVPGKAGQVDMTTTGVAALGRGDWKATGPLDQLQIAGEIQVKSIDFGGVPDLRWFWMESGSARKLDLSMGPVGLGGARLQLRISSPEGAVLTGMPGSFSADLQVRGTCSKPDFQGELRMNLSATAAGVGMEVDPLLLRFLSGAADPEIEVRASGTKSKTGFSVSAVGPLGRPLREYKAQPPLSPEVVRAVFEEGKAWR